jgi:hypothetical protein
VGAKTMNPYIVAFFKMFVLSALVTIPVPVIITANTKFVIEDTQQLLVAIFLGWLGSIIVMTILIGSGFIMFQACKRRKQHTFEEI